MASPSNLMLDAFWRAMAYCLRPRVIVLSLVPLLVMLAAVGGWSYFYWASSVAAMHQALAGGWLAMVFGWLGQGAEGFATAVAPLAVLVLATPVAVVLAVLVIAFSMTPALLRMVTARRFPLLEKKHGTGFAASTLKALGATLLAVLAFAITMPLWLIPPLVLIVPPVIWGWLTYRVMSVDALAEHASKAERDTLLRRHRWPLLVMGIVTGYLGMAPSLVWASAIVFTIGFVVLVPLAIWIYALTFAFSSLWFIHFCLAALAQLRGETGDAVVAAEPLRQLP